jgi:hypothetical protein
VKRKSVQAINSRRGAGREDDCRRPHVGIRIYFSRSNLLRRVNQLKFYSFLAVLHVAQFVGDGEHPGGGFSIAHLCIDESELIMRAQVLRVECDGAFEGRARFGVSPLPAIDISENRVRGDVFGVRTYDSF